MEDLLDHLERLSGAERSRLRQLVGEVIAYYNETLEEFVVRRHRELQREGLHDETIFGRIGAEVAGRRLRGHELSARQLRRIVYG